MPAKAGFDLFMPPEGAAAILAEPYYAGRRQ
jgi:hypothetical protein